MRRSIVIGFFTVLALPTIANGAEVRCGWYSNPTSGNLTLTDRDAVWWVQMQGRPDPNGIDKAPSFDEKQFVETNVPGTGYGYGCACLTVETNTKQRRVTRILAGNTLPLQRCKADRSLPQPE